MLIVGGTVGGAVAVQKALEAERSLPTKPRLMIALHVMAVTLARKIRLSIKSKLINS